MNEAVYIIDFSNFAYKFKSVYTYAKTNINGVSVDTSILVGFIRCIKANLAKNILIVLDGVPTQSKRLCPNYKGQRIHDEVPNGISIPKLEVIKFLTKLGPLLGKNIKVLCSPGQETDEVISSIVHLITNNIPKRVDFISKLNAKPLSSDRMLRYLDADGVVVSEYKPKFGGAIIASTDGDFIQLQRWDNVWIDISSSGKEISNGRTSKSTHEVSPIASIAYKAIYGDVSDNVQPLKIPFKKEDVVTRLNRYLKNEDDIYKFYDACTKGYDLEGLEGLSKFIYKFDRDNFERNWAVTFLTFRSYPLMLEYPNYDIGETIKKYKLKV